MLGATLVSRLGGTEVHGRIVETEAYLGYQDPASHAYRGRRYAGNGSIYLPPGYWYVYRSYGIHWCANVVTGPAGIGAAVLLRAVVVLHGEEEVRRRRHGVPSKHLADGPGKLCQGFAIDKGLDGHRIQGSAVELLPGEPVALARVTPRIGIAKAREWPLRFLARCPG